MPTEAHEESVYGFVSHADRRRFHDRQCVRSQEDRAANINRLVAIAETQRPLTQREQGLLASERAVFRDMRPIVTEIRKRQTS